jgi:hypothetical protein
MNKTSLFEALDYYRKNVQQARHVALNGYFHVMKYHRATSFIDYIFRTYHEIQLNPAITEDEVSSAYDNHPKNYTQTGFDMRRIAIKCSKKYQSCLGNV